MPLVSLLVDPDVLNTNQSIGLIHQFMGAPGFETFVKLTGSAAISLIIFSLVMNYIVLDLSRRFRVSCQTRLANRIMKMCVGAPYDWLVRQNTSTLTHYVFTDVQHWGVSIQRISTMVGQCSLLFLVAGVVLSTAALTGLFAMIVVGALSGFVVFLTRSHIRLLSENHRAASAKSFAIASEFLSGIKDVKLSSRQSAFVDSYCKSFKGATQAMGVLKLFQAAPPMLMIALGQTGIILIAMMLWGLGKSSGEIATTMALVLLVTARVIPAITRLSGEFGAIWSIIPAIEGINSLVNRLSDPIEWNVKDPNRTSHRGWKCVEIADLSYSYDHEKSGAIRNLSLTIERGKSYGIAGPTGAGKTTLVDLLLGLLLPVRGEITIDGCHLQDAEIGAWQRDIAYVPQNPLIIDDTLRANIAFGVRPEDVDEARIEECVNMANLEDVAAAVTLDGNLGERGNRISGGQRQRVAIARALYDRPNLIIFDEATSALDNLSAQAVDRALEKLKGSVTMITVAHRLPTIEKCDQIFVLENGALISQGNYEQLLHESPLFSSMVSSGMGNHANNIEKS
ncbi:MAG: ABC transporter ATP-binding protein/permease [Alphaproteobacteria bacterium]|nr:ABC transporter ATP-binding protein/permease [Alphaproteobacteria bacterium]